MTAPTLFTFTALIKLIHILLTLGLVGCVIINLILIANKQFHKIPYLPFPMLWLAIFATFTGTLLVYPKHFTFHTPWIQAAYILVVLFVSLMGLLISLRKRLMARWIWKISYLLLGILLLIIIHDAVTKTTFL